MGIFPGAVSGHFTVSLVRGGLLEADSWYFGLQPGPAFYPPHPTGVASFKAILFLMISVVAIRELAVLQRREGAETPWVLTNGT